MSRTTIHQVIGIREFILVVFYTTDADCWEFRLVSASGVVFGERKIYYTPRAAEKAAQDWLAKGR
ncbi:MAG: hypothetical protein JOZ78_08195 [Chroococcidiopsidaceae cyanobacterium CP_BM_ER_R8_30]|nr:hypothetical protein [Chroococcidiopsidaceae cyanobacterium CP_BM_ER_R8_30]